MTEGKILVSHHDGVYIIKLVGDVRVTLCTSLSKYMDAIFQSTDVEEVLVDMMAAEGVDSTTLGLLAKLAIHCDKSFGVKPIIFCADDSISRTLTNMGLDEVFDLIQESRGTIESYEELSEISSDMDEVKHQVLEAHKLLAVLSKQNQQEFVDLIRVLEQSN